MCKSHGAWSRTCSVDGCKRVACINLMCKKHYCQAAETIQRKENEAKAYAQSLSLPTQAPFQRDSLARNDTSDIVPQAQMMLAAQNALSAQMELAHMLAIQNRMSLLRASSLYPIDARSFALAHQSPLVFNTDRPRQLPSRDDFNQYILDTTQRRIVAPNHHRMNMVEPDSSAAASMLCLARTRSQPFSGINQGQRHFFC